MRPTTDDATNSIADPVANVVSHISTDQLSNSKTDSSANIESDFQPHGHTDRETNPATDNGWANCNTNDCHADVFSNVEPYVFTNSVAYRHPNEGTDSRADNNTNDGPYCGAFYSTTHVRSTIVARMCIFRAQTTITGLSSLCIALANVNKDDHINELQNCA